MDTDCICFEELLACIKHKNSILSSFNFNILSPIHKLISSMHLSSQSTQSSLWFEREKDLMLFSIKVIGDAMFPADVSKMHGVKG